MTSPVTVVYGSATDPGLRRRINEDSHIAAEPLFLVADGMGGHHAGEIAVLECRDDVGHVHEQAGQSKRREQRADQVHDDQL